MGILLFSYMLNQFQRGLSFSCLGPCCPVAVVEFEQLFQDVLYMTVINKSKTGQLDPLALAGSTVIEEESPCMSWLYPYQR